MPTEIITTDDLREFKIELLDDIKNSSHMANKKYLKSPDIMKILNISSGTLQTMSINGMLPYTKIGGIIFYDPDEISTVMKENRTQN